MSEQADAEGSPRRRQRAWPSWPAGIAFLAAIAGGIGFGWSYVWQVSDWWLGGFLALGMLGLGAGLTYWGVYLHHEDVAREDFPYPHVDEAERAALTEELECNEDVITRKRFLGLLLGAGATILAIGTLFPVQSLGQLPGDTLFHTKWRRGSRLVTTDGQLVSRGALSLGGFVIAFPEGHTDSAESPVALFKVAADSLELPAGRESWTPDGFVAYSIICTHAGCAATQYEDESQLLLCPCHDSAFDILRGAKPIYGPARRALPQLPLMIDGQGNLAAQSDFEEPVGPGFWNLP
ncbi:MAG: Rieske (2Fe-2S) protein [Actinobacteria bacterium]|nr:Rieske (2Fe-2S) protein [Actinomycetota bacterium]